MNVAMTNVPQLIDIVVMLAQVIGVGAVLKFLFDQFKWFANLPADKKRLVVLGISIGLPILATVALQFIPPDVWNAIEPYWQVIARGFLLFAGTQVVHKVDKALARKSTLEMTLPVDEEDALTN